MTTRAAEQYYLAKHLLEVEGKPYAIFNPHNNPIESLPVIMGFNNGGLPGWFSAVSIAQDGECLGQHICSLEGYMPHDLGIYEGTRLDRHAESYQKHYPDGYRMAFIPTEEIAGCELLQKAFALSREKAKAAELSPETTQRKEPTK